MARKLGNYQKQRSTTNADKELGVRIRVRRIEANMSQEQLGKKLGVSFQQVQKYEKGINRVGVTRLHQIAEALGESMAYFTGPVEPTTSTMHSLLINNSAQRVLRAFTEIPDADVKHKVMSIVETISGLMIASGIKAPSKRSAAKAP